MCSDSNAACRLVSPIDRKREVKRNNPSYRYNSSSRYRGDMKGGRRRGDTGPIIKLKDSYEVPPLKATWKLSPAASRVEQIPTAAIDSSN